MKDIVRFINEAASKKFDYWKDVIEFTDEIWKYKDLFLSIEEVEKIEYIKNEHVALK
jgi:hypothetical protein